jgi:hypothetical protein
MTETATAATEEAYPPVSEECKIIFWSMGDANKDGIIDMKDLRGILKIYPNYDPDYDFNGDGVIDMKDIRMVSKNQGLTIEEFWHNIVDKEREQEKLSETTGVPNLPWYVDWILPLLKQQKTNLEAYAYWQQPAMAALVEGCKSIASMMGDYPDAELEAEQKKADFYQATHAEQMHEVLNGNMATLPTPIKDISSQMNTHYGNLIHGLLDAVDPSKYMAGDGSDEQVFLMSVEMQNKVKEYLQTANLMSDIGSALTLGLIDSGGKWIDFCKSITGAGAIPPYINSLAAMKVFQSGLDRYFNTLWAPYIPKEADWIDAYIKGDMTQNDFYREMRRLGYAAEYADIMVKVSMTPPSVADALTAWRRGLITDVDLDLLFKRNRLDPAWQNIFDVRKFNDISLGEAHTLYDLGIANRDKVFDTARRAGYDATDATAVTDSIVNFPIRRLKLRQLLNIVTAYSYDVISMAAVSDLIGELGYGDAVSVWAIKVGDLRKQILNRSKAAKVKEKLLAVGDLKAAYMRGLLTEDQFRIELLTRHYNLDEVTILIELMTERRTVEQAGGKMYALSVIELLNAWRYSVITEDMLRNKLLARGLPLDELDTLIATKKVQWQITPTAG